GGARRSHERPAPAPTVEDPELDALDSEPANEVSATQRVGTAEQPDAAESEPRRGKRSSKEGTHSRGRSRRRGPKRGTEPATEPAGTELPPVSEATREPAAPEPRPEQPKEPPRCMESAERRTEEDGASGEVP